MLRSLLRVSGAVALAALLAPATPSAAPGPGLAYDEIVQVLVSGTPPPPGNFQNDVAAVNAPPPAVVIASPTPAPHRAFSFGQIASAVINGGNPGAVAQNVAANVASDALDNALANALNAKLGSAFGGWTNALRGFLQPHLMHYAYWNGWERVDDVSAQTATIRKCDMGQVVQLDLSRKTYTIYDPSQEPARSAPAPPAARPARPATPSTPAPPGTAVVTLSSTTKALGPLQIEQHPTSGFDATTTFAMSQATGSCRNASASIRHLDYISQLPQPTVNSCPIVRPPVIPERETDLVAPPQPQGGCKPTLNVQSSGPAPPTGHLSLYTLLTMSAAAGATPAPGAPATAGIGFLTERGNLKTLGPSDAGLFEIPAGFTKQ